MSFSVRLNKLHSFEFWYYICQCEWVHLHVWNYRAYFQGYITCSEWFLTALIKKHETELDKTHSLFLSYAAQGHNSDT